VPNGTIALDTPGRFANWAALRARKADFLCADGAPLGRVQYVEQAVPKPLLYGGYLRARIGFFLHTGWHLENDVQCKACDERRNRVVLKTGPAVNSVMSRYVTGNCLGTFSENLLHEANVTTRGGALHFTFDCEERLSCRKRFSSRAALCFYPLEASQRGIYLGQVSFFNGSGTEIWGFLIFLLYMCGLVPLLCMCCSAAYAGKLRLCMHRSRLTFLSRELDELRQSAPAESDAVLSELRRELEDQIAQVQQELADVRPRGRLQQERELRAALMRGSEESDADMQEIIDEIIALQEAGFDTDDARSRR
jgi:hypothetical protein